MFVGRTVGIITFSGHIEHLGTIGRFSIFLFVFEKVTKCSEASRNDFSGVDFPSEDMKFPEISLQRNVAWSFFSLNNKSEDKLQNYFTDPRNQVLRVDFCYPQPHSENDRMSLPSTIH